jgi:hypothetical protein
MKLILQTIQNIQYTFWHSDSSLQWRCLSLYVNGAEGNLFLHLLSVHVPGSQLIQYHPSSASYTAITIQIAVNTDTLCQGNVILLDRGFTVQESDEFSVQLQHRWYNTRIYLKFYSIILLNTTSGFQQRRFANNCHRHFVWLSVAGLPCQELESFFIQRPCWITCRSKNAINLPLKIFLISCDRPFNG